MKPPCKDCPKRALNCRSECDAWKDYEAERNEKYKKKRFGCEIAGYIVSKQSKRMHRDHITRRCSK